MIKHHREADSLIRLESHSIALLKLYHFSVIFPGFPTEPHYIMKLLSQILPNFAQFLHLLLRLTFSLASTDNDKRFPYLEVHCMDLLAAVISHWPSSTLARDVIQKYSS